MSDVYVFRPRPTRDPFIPTGQTTEAMSLTDAAHDHPSVVVWTGPSGAGKTWASREMVRRVNDAYNEENPNSFQAFHHEVCSDVRTKRMRGSKSGIRRLYNAIVGPIEPFIFDRTSEEELAQRIIRVMRKKRIQMLFIDEAGTLQVEELRGLTHVRNVAESMEWRLTMVLIGMDELPERITALGQVERRVVHWAYFKPYALDKDWWRLLGGLNRHFAALDPRSAADTEQMKFVHGVYKGLLGELMTFLRRLTLRMRQHPEVPVDLEYLETIYAELQIPKQQALFSAETHYRVPLPQDKVLLDAAQVEREAGDGSPKGEVSGGESAREQKPGSRRGPQRKRGKHGG